MLSVILCVISVIISVDSSTSSNKQCYGPDYTEIYPFYGIPSDLCIHAEYDSSQTKALTISLTMGNAIYGTETITDEDPAEQEHTICDPDFSSSALQGLHACSLCLGFDDIFLSDDWARICPKYILHCKTPVGLAYKKEISTPCFVVGDDDKDDLAVIVGGNTDFTFNLLASNALTNDIVTDLFVSPFAISNALIASMMAAGGDTLEQLLNAFELTSDDYDVFDSFDTLVQSLEHKSATLTGSVLNKLWLSTSWDQVLNPRYLRDFDRFGDIEACNFKNNSYAETMRIDSEAEEATNNLIEHPLANKQLSSSTVLLFTNTMYLKANWMYPFTTSVSHTFTDDTKEKVTIEMMQTDEISVNAHIDDNVQIIELPFDDELSDISFIMIRHTDEYFFEENPTSTIELEKNLNRQLLDKWLAALKQTDGTQLKVTLPFLEMYNMQDITDGLRSIGITDMFDPKKADLTNLTTAHYQVYETNLNRQDYLKIGMQGVEIASFVTDGNNDKDETNQGKVEHADLPFLFLVIDRSVNLVLYAGRVTNPKGWMLDDGGDDSHEHAHHGSHAAKAVFLVLLILICSYCGIKYVYNLLVMQSRGMEAIPHIEQFRFCKDWCTEKVGEMRSRASQASDDSVGSNRVEKYKQLMEGDDNL